MAETLAPGNVDSTGPEVKMTANAPVQGALTGAAAGSFAGPIGAAIGGAAGLAGGFLSNASNKSTANTNWEHQKEALQNSVRWRVADAKAAGIHPLYAMGQAPMTVSPMGFEDRIGPELKNMGQDVGNVVANMKTNQEQTNMKMDRWYQEQMNVAQLRNTDALTAKYLSEASRADRERPNISPPGLGVQNEFGADPGTHGQGLVDVKAAEQLTTKKDQPWSSAGANPGYQLRYLDKGLPMYLPIAEGDSPEETISEMSLPAWAGLLQRNARIFGKGWMRDMINSRYMGMEVTGKYDPKSQRKGGK
ncbi:MAG: DNA pilot protein [Microvirus sp.]|nr:MAG: DNA pilot protein [Microvirus sp.]